MDFTKVAERIIAKAMKKRDDRNPLPDNVMITLLNYSLVDPEVIIVYTNRETETQGFWGHRIYYQGRIFAGVTTSQVYDL